MFSKIIPTAVQLVTGFSKASLCSGLLVHLSSSASACHFLISSVNGEQEMCFFFPPLKYLGVHQKAVIISYNFAELDYTLRCRRNLTSGLGELGLELRDSGLMVRSMRLSSLEYLTSSGFFFFLRI